MDQSHESLISMSQFRPMIVSPRIPPQLNETICSCQCGCGCGCAGHGETDIDRVSDTDTAVDSISSDDEDYPQGQRVQDGAFDGHDTNHIEQGIHSPRALSHQEIAWFLGRVLGRLEELQFGEPLASWEEASIRPPVHDAHEDVAGGLLDDIFSTEARSAAASGRGSVQMISPGPGIGGWLQVLPDVPSIEDVQRVYIFTPLRLSAEYQHARGKAVEHLLVPDDASILNME